MRKLFIGIILMWWIPTMLNAQTVCAYQTEGEIYIITYKKTITATLTPNPSSGHIVLKIGEVTPDDDFSVSIYDPYRLISFNVIGEETPIDCTGLAKGVYNYLIRNQGQVVKHGKFVIQ